MEVTGGALRAGMQVVVKGNENLRAGMPVRLQGKGGRPGGGRGGPPRGGAPRGGSPGRGGKPAADSRRGAGG